MLRLYLPAALWIVQVVRLPPIERTAFPILAQSREPPHILDTAPIPTLQGSNIRRSEDILPLRIASFFVPCHLRWLGPQRQSSSSAFPLRSRDGARGGDRRSPSVHKIPVHVCALRPNRK